MELGIKDKVALVTGGAQGIGEAITRNLLNEGAYVFATTRSEAAANDLTEKLPEFKAKLRLINSSLTEDGDVESVVDQVKLTGKKIDILVNNAGHTLNITDPFCSIDDWRTVFALNFEVAVKLVNLCAPDMKKSMWGRIVNITSCAGLENSGPVTFSTVKAALTAYTRSMGRVFAIEQPETVMSALFPGVVLTKGGHWEEVLRTNPEHAEQYLKERCPLGRFGNVDEIGPLVAVYCSELASFSHGAIVPVDAGQSKHFMSFNYMD